MIIDYNEGMGGHILTLQRGDNVQRILSCINCGKPVNDIPCFLCETMGRLVHHECEWRTNEKISELSNIKKNFYHAKCRNLKKKEHMHIRIIKINNMEVK
jgi:hypothetical protein